MSADCTVATSVEATPTMRLDVFLWHARIVKKRADARALAEDGRLRLDGRPVSRPAQLVRPGCTLGFADARGQVRAIRVLSLPARRGPPAEARACYVDLLDNSPSDSAPVPSHVDAGLRLA